MKNSNSLYRITRPNGNEDYVVALNIVDAVTNHVSVLPCGFIDTAEKVEWVKGFEITDLALLHILKVEKVNEIINKV